MTIDERFEQTGIQLQLLTLKTGEQEKRMDQLTRNLNELTLKVDGLASNIGQLAEGQQKLNASLNDLTLKVDLTASQLRESHQELAASHEKLAVVFKTMADLVINHDSRIRRIACLRADSKGYLGGFISQLLTLSASDNMYYVNSHSSAIRTSTFNSSGRRICRTLSPAARAELTP